MPKIGAYQDVFFPDDNNPGAKAEYAVRNLDVYICKGGEKEVYYPRFAFTGFRYVYIEGCRRELTTSSVKRLLMNTDLCEVGEIKSGDADISLIWDVVKRSYRSNIFTGPTDCPTREKNFWNGDIQGFVNTALWYMDNDKFLSTWTKYGRKIEYNVYGWEDEEYILPLALYKFYGDKSVVADKYTTVLNLISKREEQNKDRLFPKDSYSPYRDHKAVQNVPADFYGAVYYTFMYKGAAQMARILEKYEDEEKFLAKFNALKEKFNEIYYLPDKFDYTPACQSGVVFALAFGLAPESDRKGIAATLHKYVERADYHFTTGFMTSEHILGVLCDFGYTSDAYKIIKSRTYPSILDMIDSGATTTTENWTGHREKFEYDSMNHYAFGGFSRWFFEYPAGIKIDSPGFDKITIAPTLIAELGSFFASYKTKFGVVESRWRYENGRFCVRCKIPNGIVANFKLPSGECIPLSEGEIKFTV